MKKAAVVSAGCALVIGIAGIAGTSATAAGATVTESSKQSATTAVQSVSSKSLGLGELAPCTTKHEYTACVYGVNNTQFFTGPNQLAGGKYQLAPDTYNVGTDYIDWWWPPTWPGGSQAKCPNSGPQWTPVNPWCLQAGDSDDGTLSMAVYNPPVDANGNSALPPWDQLYVTYSVLGGEGNHGTCGLSPDLKSGSSANYTSCPKGTPQFEGGNHPNFVFTIDNQPLTIQIMNNLAAGNDLALDDGVSVSPSLQLDPAGGTPSTIAAGSTGYYGAYQPITVKPGLGSPRIGFTYTLGNLATTLPGASFVINLVLDGAGGIQNSADACQFLAGGANQNGSCSVSIAGAEGGPQVITVDITSSTPGLASSPTATPADRGTSR